MNRYTFRAACSGTFFRTASVEATTEEEARELFLMGDFEYFEDTDLDCEYMGEAELRRQVALSSKEAS